VDGVFHFIVLSLQARLVDLANRQSRALSSNLPFCAISSIVQRGMSLKAGRISNEE